jgi:nicotinamide-nucleotide adenylyltransferase
MGADTAHGQEWLDRYMAAGRDLMDLGHVLDVDARVHAGQRAHERLTLLAGGDRARQATRVGVLAGSFNPMTIAHAAVAEAVSAAGMDTLLWALARVTVDKEQVTRASLVDRAIQVEAHLRGRPMDGVLVMDAGLYADQAQALRAVLRPETELWLIVGFDKIVQIFDPRYYDDRDFALRRLFSTAGLLVVPREGSSAPDLAALLAAPANRPYAARVRYLPLPHDLARISSTAARARAGDAGNAGSPEAWRALLTPEGAALTLETGAYDPPFHLSDGDVVERYALRLAWIETLRSVPERERLALSLARLMERACAQNASGTAIRRWLHGARQPGDPEDAVALIARYG